MENNAAKCVTATFVKDLLGYVVIVCNSCRTTHTFKSEYFAKTWFNRHAEQRYSPINRTRRIRRV